MIASEFFDQGDIERLEFNIEPVDMMDRQRAADLPRMQISFIDAVCLPVYKVDHLPFTLRSYDTIRYGTIHRQRTDTKLCYK